MKPLHAAILATGAAALGGALAVFGSYDDSPGGTVLGIALALGAMVFEARRAART